MATMTIRDKDGTDRGTIILGASAAGAESMGAVDWMRPTHGGFRTEGLAIGYVKRLIGKGGPRGEWWVTSDRAVAGPMAGQRIYGVWVK
jgi:hypothetical protein